MEPSADVKKIYEKAIKEMIPVFFYYSSQKSKYFPGEETPSHARIVQPVAFGYRIKRNGEKVYYVRAYLLQKYSYSRNKAYPIGITTKKYTPKVKNWRLYRIDRQSKLQLLPDYPQEYRAYVWNYSSYNADDSFFSVILYSVLQTGAAKVTYTNPRSPLNTGAPDYSRYTDDGNFYYPEAFVRSINTPYMQKIKSLHIPIHIPIVFFRDKDNPKFLGFVENKILFLNKEIFHKYHEKDLNTKLRYILNYLGEGTYHGI